MIRTANDYGAIYSTGKNNEGILILTDTTRPYPFTASLKMMTEMLKALGFKGFKSIMDKFQSDGESLEKKYRRAKKDFVQIELIAVKRNIRDRAL